MTGFIFSPANLKGFIRIRESMTYCEHKDAPPACRLCRRNYRQYLRARAKVTRAAMDSAAAGRLVNGELRTRIWRAMDYHPAASGVRLTDDGGQEAMP